MLLIQPRKFTTLYATREGNYRNMGSMMGLRKYSFLISVRSPGRQTEEEWKIIGPQQADFWKSAIRRLSGRSYQHNGYDIEVKIDWAPLARRLIRDHKLLIPVRTYQPSKVDWFAKLDKPLYLAATCSIVGDSDFDGYQWYPGFFVEYFLYEIFMIVNLSCPGVAEFYNFEIQRTDQTQSQRLQLSAFYFDEWMVATLEGEGPVARIIKADEVIDWFRKVNPAVTQKAENSTQRAIYALYQICRSEGDISIILWLFNALESLLGTRVGENFSGLTRRAAILLELDEKEKRLLSKKLRELYDLRSAFVHGGYEVTHPLHSESIDPRLDDDYLRIIRLSSYGFGVLGALLQSMILRKIPIAVFEEKLVSF